MSSSDQYSSDEEMAKINQSIDNLIEDLDDFELGSDVAVNSLDSSSKNSSERPSAIPSRLMNPIKSSSPPHTHTPTEFSEAKQNFNPGKRTLGDMKISRPTPLKQTETGLQPVRSSTAKKTLSKKNKTTRKKRAAEKYAAPEPMADSPLTDDDFEFDEPPGVRETFREITEKGELPIDQSENRLVQLETEIWPQYDDEMFEDTLGQISEIFFESDENDFDTRQRIINMLYDNLEDNPNLSFERQMKIQNMIAALTSDIISGPPKGKKRKGGFKKNNNKKKVTKKKKHHEPFVIGAAVIGHIYSRIKGTKKKKSKKTTNKNIKKKRNTKKK